MTNKHESVFLQFDFLSEAGVGQTPLLFSNPVNVITTASFSAIPSCLKDIEQAINEGYYVAGYFSYEMTYAFSEEFDISSVKSKIPLLWFGVFNNPTETTYTSVKQHDFQIGNWEMQLTPQAYERTFQKIMQAIEDKETAQINYTVPFEANFSGNPYPYYEQLKSAQKSNYCAFLQMDTHTVLSASPELFFHVKDEHITVRPMKGTAKRGLTYESDMAQKHWLQHSEKNKNENNLITQLMKEELKKVTDKHTIQMIDPYRVEKYPTVYQMTTGIKGKIRPALSMIDIVRALFPCGSISGVPKQSSLQLIKETEQIPRGVYCGAIGYFSPKKEAIFNVPIRTVSIDEQKQKAYYGAGGAITEKSIMQEEYEEVLTKTDVLTWKQPHFELLETLAIHDGQLFLLEEHLHRLQASADYFDIPLDLEIIRTHLENKAKAYSNGNWRIKLTMNHEGIIHIDVYPLLKTTKQKVVLAKEPIDQNDLYIYHKTTHRILYEKHQVKDDSILDVLLWNDQQEITEFTIGNVVVELDGELVTPPISSGLLAGTFRSKLLQDGIIKKRIISKDDLDRCVNIWLINSVRQWVKVNLT